MLGHSPLKCQLVPSDGTAGGSAVRVGTPNSDFAVKAREGTTSLTGAILHRRVPLKALPAPQADFQSYVL